MTECTLNRSSQGFELMSRIILSRHNNGGEHLVVGWDHPARGAFWQEYASLSEIETATATLEEIESGKSNADPFEEERLMRIVETGVKRSGGDWPGIPIDRLSNSVPEELRELITDKVIQMLYRHAKNPNSGYTEDRIIDLTEDK